MVAIQNTDNFFKTVLILLRVDLILIWYFSHSHSSWRIALIFSPCVVVIVLDIPTEFLLDRTTFHLFQISFHSCQAFPKIWLSPSYRGVKMKSCPIWQKLGGYVKHYNHDTWWKDEGDPLRTVAVRAISNFLPLLSGFGQDPKFD